MTVYKKLYLNLFNTCTDCIRQIDREHYGEAKEILIQAQQDAEETYISDDEEE